MSKIDELLKNEKVEWKKLGEVCEIIGGSSFPKSFQGKNYGKYAFYKVSDMNKCTILMKTSENYIDDDDLKKLKAKLIPKNSVIFPKVGATLATNKKRLLIKESCIDNNILALVAKEIHYKYLYHIFAKEQLLSFANGKGAVPSIDMEKLKNFKIPIPSIETQEKIVKTLDKFTNYVTELQAELQARTKQYEYYRDMLLSEEYLNKITAEIIGSGCSNEITFCRIKDVCNRQKGINITAEKMKELNKEDAPVKIFAGGNTTANLEIDMVGENNIIEIPSVIVKSRGNIDFEYYDKPFSHKNEMWSYSTINDKVLNIKFLFYLLKNNLKYFRDNSISGKLPQISTGVTDNYKIPILSIEIQNKIVKILDKFQSLLADTKGLLPQEIEQRQKQYEYYREKLLTFNENSAKHTHTHNLISNSYFDLLKEAASISDVKLFEVEWKVLGSIGVFENGTGMPKSLFDETGSVGAIHYGHIYTKYNLFVNQPIVRVTKKNAKNLKVVNKGDLVIAKTSENIEDVMKTVAYLGEDYAVTGGHSAIFRHKENPKYLSHVFNGAKYLLRQKNKLARGVKVIELSITDMEKIKIPVPPIKVQEHIVEILDKFDTIVNDISKGLPKEIELRQKQYEYYREKLLSFEK